MRSSSPRLIPLWFCSIAIRLRYQLRYWDSLIVAAANRYGCTEIVSEDMSHGQSYHGSVTTRFVAI